MQDQQRIAIQGLQHGKPCTLSNMAREEESFYIKEVERVLVNKESMVFTGRVLARKEEESFFFLLSSAIITGHESSPFWSFDSA